MQVVTIFGSNSGNKYQLIQEASILLSSSVGKIITTSSYYETAPWGFTAQENFLNKIIVFETSLHPQTFLKHCLQTENLLGRRRAKNGPRYTSRPIDIDILFYDTQIVNTPELIIPHPRIRERNFVLTPLTEILPHFVHPVLQKTILQLKEECPDKLSVKKITPA